MNRRTLLGLAVAGAAGMGAVAVGTSTRPGQVKLLASLIRSELSDFSDLGDAPERYAEDFVDAYGGLARGDELYLNFLLSTDFFLKGEDPTQRLSYVGLYDPLINPCLVTVPRREEG